MHLDFSVWKGPKIPGGTGLYIMFDLENKGPGLNMEKVVSKFEYLKDMEMCIH